MINFCRSKRRTNFFKEYNISRIESEFGTKTLGFGFGFGFGGLGLDLRYRFAFEPNPQK